MNLSRNPVLRAAVATACLWEAAQIASNGPWTWSAGARYLKRSKAGRTALVALCGVLAYHLAYEGD